MAPFGRTALPRPGQASARARVFAALAGLWLMVGFARTLGAQQPPATPTQVTPEPAQGSPSGALGASNASVPAAPAAPTQQAALEDILTVDAGATCLEGDRLVQRVA